MRKLNARKMLSLVLCVMLLAAAAMTAFAGEVTETETVFDMGGTQEAPVILGEGETVFMFVVTDTDGNESWFEIHTDRTVVGEALTELGLIAGEQGPYGLYVKDVCGIHAAYEEDGHYWSFYVNGEYALSGVDTTEIDPDALYLLKVD